MKKIPIKIHGKVVGSADVYEDDGEGIIVTAEINSDLLSEEERAFFFGPNDYSHFSILSNEDNG